MPTLEWNKRWGQEVKKFQLQKDADYYGIQWGNPSVSGISYWIQKLWLGRKLPGDLSKVVKHYIAPYITEDTIVLEIGPGGGRWTQYFLEAREIILADLNSEFFSYLGKRFTAVDSKFRYYQTSGFELNGIASEYVDFIFSFGTFVHIDPDGIDEYLSEIKRVLKLGAIGVIQYSDKTKKRGHEIEAFSDMNSEKMLALISKHNLKVVSHDTRRLNHSNIIVIKK